MAPKNIIIVPYRDREKHKNMFLEQMVHNFRHLEDYKIYFAHQDDERPFNRGAMKNLGFLITKRMYPNDYKDITYIFHDVDCWHRQPGAIHYLCEKGKVSHFYGYEFALGGMFSIKGEDFEKTGGFPNFWGWGLEDNVIYERCKKVGLEIDRSCFFKIENREIARPFDGFKRVISKKDSYVYKYESPDSFYDIRNVSYKVIDNMINITTFNVKMNENQQEYEEFDIRKGNKLQVPKFRRKAWNFQFNN